MNSVSRPDPFAKSQYRRLFAWSERLEREWPLLESVLPPAGGAPRVLDLGCGSGEHSAFLHEKGYAVTGVDASAEQIESAREYDGPSFVVCAMEDMAHTLTPEFDAAICLGNVLPYLDAASLQKSLGGLAELLTPRAPVLVQIVNYPGLRERGVRSLPVNVRPGDGPDEELVLLRTLRYCEDGRVLFSPTTLRWRAEADPPTEIAWTKTVTLHPWSDDDLTRFAAESGFEVIDRFGTISRDPFDPIQSHDLFLLMQRV